jgi:hypothetical protein
VAEDQEVTCGPRPQQRQPVAEPPEHERDDRPGRGVPRGAEERAGEGDPSGPKVPRRTTRRI